MLGWHFIAALAITLIAHGVLVPMGERERIADRVTVFVSWMSCLPVYHFVFGGGLKVVPPYEGNRFNPALFYPVALGVTVLLSLLERALLALARQRRTRQ
jgi:hypothetical protein